MLGFDCKYVAVQPKAKLWRFLVKNDKKSDVKLSIGKPILFTFLNFSATLRPRLSEETDFHWSLGPDPLILHFLQLLVLEKTHSLFKLIFKATQFQEIPQYDIFQKTLFFTLVSSMNLGLNAFPGAARQYL